ncbi:SDR family oxidoreductase [Ferrimonas balearica]|uniref:SDR family oxidoreductase n=1 Tax=Ferrimonas balearica TaxID=44012 RepID=UPI001C9970FE|nr:SDR family oxidoreductase [Ferrimonas balearica]MBY5993464.1 SDR family oxidoreductase [Ferrimonas balearica]
MGYFITGATGFIGRFLLARLAKRPGPLYCLVRSDEDAIRLAEIGRPLGLDGERLIPIQGDITQPDLGLCDANLDRLTGHIDHLFHLAAIYDLKASAEDQIRANVEGTKHTLALAKRIQAGCFHHVSSIAAAGLYRGHFNETMFDEAEQLEHPYFLTKHLGEKAVRESEGLQYRIYRPGIVVGDSKTGEADRVDGPYLFFKLLQKLRDNLPRWMPLLGVEGGRLNIVPVDFVTDAMDHLAHLPDLDGQCFHLTDPQPMRAGEVLNLFADAGHAPRMAMRINTRLFDVVPRHLWHSVASYPPVKRIGAALLKEYGLPEAALKLINYPTRFDCERTQALLQAGGIHCPPLSSYAERVWDYWERHLDPDLFVERTLQQKLAGKRVLLTGASSGIGLATALKLAPSGARLLLVAREEEELHQACRQVESLGGEAYPLVLDLTDPEQTDALLAKIHAEHGGVDLLINNAGRSIRRAVADSLDRMHDFERTMAINYFAALRLTLGTLEGMEQRRRGHIVNISSIGVLTNAPRFSAYVASKAALEAFSRCAASEYSDLGIRFTTINMPLVRTPMIAPTKLYDEVPTLTPEQAADMVVQGILHQPKRIATRLGIFGAVLHAVAPRIAEIVMNSAFRMFPDSDSAERDLKAQQDRIGFAALLRGIHF